MYLRVFLTKLLAFKVVCVQNLFIGNFFLVVCLLHDSFYVISKLMKQLDLYEVLVTSP